MHKLDHVVIAANNLDEGTSYVENKLNVKSVSANKPTLDDVFLKVTGFSMENDNQSEKKQSKKSNYEKRGRRIRR